MSIKKLININNYLTKSAAMPDLLSHLSEESAKKLQASVKGHQIEKEKGLLLRAPLHEVERDRLLREAAYAHDRADISNKWEGIFINTLFFSIFLFFFLFLLCVLLLFV